MIKDPVLRVIRAGVLLAVVDGAFSGILSAFFYNSTVTRLFQGVASTLLGKGALDGGTQTAVIGVLMHIGVAFGWSAVFLLIAMRSESLQRVIETPTGVVIAAAIYGPCIWLVMSLIVIPLLRHTPITFSFRWWVQFFGHIPFVGIPIVSQIASGLGVRVRSTEAVPA
jgi:uncharacterized membrane protein YagU involved in acid resistance